MQILKGHWQLILITFVLFLFWNTAIVVPLKILVVYLHELSHALAAILTGGSVVEISLSPYQGGHAITRGGSRFLTLTAGYLGSLLFGVTLLLLALKTEADRIILGCLGAFTLVVTALYIRDWFALAFCLGTGAAMLAAARYLSVEVNDLILRVIGLSSILYVPYDIFDDTIRRSGIRSDAYMLAEEFGGPTIFWGGLWLAASLAIIYFCLRHGLGDSSNMHFGKRGQQS
ncbi:M50 family metallopeptidase [Roseibium sediminicola]|uniref:M50 family metallopeptidase n=1 Tax=Roseibium sediminicola TaxID=2933272 RepID=A0ABT0GV93_9HYPH|nr:M50 family metallopeptidase [Roseibium sp. CAU 1639]MCK7613140.1 M50 family metallopeptidase [Roseibium sp. CAU 1639]